MARWITGAGVLRSGSPMLRMSHVFATFAGGDGLVVSAPGISTGVLDAAHERGKVHVLTVRGQC